MREGLREARKKAEWTQKQVADAAGIDRTAYCRIELGQLRPDVEVAIKIAEFLGGKVEDFFTPSDVHSMHNEQATTLDMKEGA